MARLLAWMVVALPAVNALAVDAPTIADTPKTIDPASLLPEALTKPVTGDFRESSLRELAEWLRDDVGATVLVHERALDDAGVTLAEPVDDRVDDQPLYLLLDRLRQIEVAWYSEAGVLHLTSEEDALTRYVTQAYNVSDLIDAGYSVDQVIETITSTIATDSWAENGGGVG